MWNKTHEFTLINKTELDKAKITNDKANESTPEFGLQMTQQGYDAYLCNIEPVVTNADNTRCLARGCHVMHAIKYLTLTEAKYLSNKWSIKREETI